MGIPGAPPSGGGLEGSGSFTGGALGSMVPSFRAGKARWLFWNCSSAGRGMARGSEGMVCCGPIPEKVPAETTLTFACSANSGCIPGSSFTKATLPCTVRREVVSFWASKLTKKSVPRIPMAADFVLTIIFSLEGAMDLVTMARMLPPKRLRVVTFVSETFSSIAVDEEMVSLELSERSNFTKLRSPVLS